MSETPRETMLNSMEALLPEGWTLTVRCWPEARYEAACGDLSCHAPDFEALLAEIAHFMEDYDV